MLEDNPKSTVRMARSMIHSFIVNFVYYPARPSGPNFFFFDPSSFFGVSQFTFEQNNSNSG
jgi:hypothetical protein